MARNKAGSAGGNDEIEAALQVAADQGRPLPERLAALLPLSTSEAPAAQRLAANMALVAVVQSLMEGGIPPSLLVPLNRLLQALIGVDRGIRNPMLEPTQGRKGIGMTEKRLRGAIAAAVDARMASGESLAQATEWVARTTRQWPIARSVKRNNLAKAIEDWREHAMGGRPEHDDDAAAYRQYRDALPDLPPRQRAEAILGSARISNAVPNDPK